MTMYHLLASAPFSTPLNASLMRSLGRSRAPLARAGYALNGDPLRAKIAVSEKLFGHAASGFENFFSHASTRAEITAARLDAPIQRLVIVATPQVDLFPALWRGIAARCQIDSFESHKNAIFGATRGWADLVEDLLNTIEPAEIIVIPGTPSVSAAAAELVPGAQIEVDASVDPVMEDTALAMIQRLYRQGKTLPPRQLLRLQAWHARLPQGAPLASFTAPEAEYLNARFEEDMDRLGALKRVRIAAYETPALLAAQ